MFPLQSFLLVFSVPLSVCIGHSGDNDTNDDTDCWPFCKQSKWSGGKKLPASSYSEYTTTYRPEQVPPVAAYNEASKGMDTPTLMVLIVILVTFSLLMRHLNDFFNGNTITLVKEGTWGSRFRRRGDDKRYLKEIETRFSEMFIQLQENEERMRVRSGRPLEVGWDVDVDTDD